jgi:type IV fimbrial biogenesis protein FimT
MPARSRQAGLTLVELMITLTIVVIIASLALPSFINLIKDNRRTVIVNELLSSALFARAEAAKRGQPVSLCARTSTSGTACADTPTWDYGWMVFVDPNGNGNATAGNILRQYVSPYGGDIKVRSNTLGATTGYVVMRPFNQGGTQASLLVCDTRGAAKARVVCIESNGRAQASDKTCDTAAALTCP